MVDRVKLGKASRDKGKRGERWVANFLKDRGFPARRGVQFSGGKDSPDVVCDSLSFLHFEVKWVEKLNLKDAYKQAKNDAQDKIPIVVHKSRNESAKVCINFWDFVDLMQMVEDKVDKMNNFIEIRSKYGKGNDVRLESDSDYL